MRLTVLALSLLLLATPALAQNATPATGTPVPATAAAPATGNSWLDGPIPKGVGDLVDVKTLPALQNLVQAGTEVRYLGDEYGVKAYFMTNKGQGQVVYVTPDNQAVLVGTLFSGDGNAITFMQLLRLRRTGFDPTPFFNNANAQPGQTQSGSTGTTPAASNVSPGEKLLQDTGSASWFAFGQPSGVPLTVFMDPNCDHCHAFFKQLLPYTQQNKIYLRVIPISLVDPIKSRQDVFNILSANNPATAWTSFINGETLAAVSSPDDKVAMALLNNNKLFTDWQLKVTPYSVYRAQGGDVKVMAAVPTDFAAFLADLGVQP